jgi:hypothetical protein
VRYFRISVAFPARRATKPVKVSPLAPRRTEQSAVHGIIGPPLTFMNRRRWPHVAPNGRAACPRNQPKAGRRGYPVRAWAVAYPIGLVLCEGRAESGPTRNGGPIPYSESRRFLRFFHAINRLAACFKNLGFCFVSRPIRQALTLDTLKSRRRPFPVSEAEFGAPIEPELKLVQIAL